MAIYNINAGEVAFAYDFSGNEINFAYDINGNVCHTKTAGYYEEIFFGYVDNYIAEYGLFIDGEPATREEISEWMLNRNNCKYRGKLSKSGKYLLDKNGDYFNLQGIGTHHLIQYANLHTFNSLKALKYCGINCVRMSAYLNNHYFTYSDGQLAKGYLTIPVSTKNEMNSIIEHCCDLGLYVLVDWHVWAGGGETLNTPYAVDFFTYFAQKYANYDNVLYELANEPFSDSLEDIVTHCKRTSDAIKTYVTNPIMVCGVRSFTNGVMELYNAFQAEGINDIFISQHRYLSGSALSTFETWWQNDIPLFITEWSNTSASTGEQSDMNVTEGNNFLQFFHQNHIPNCIWKFTDQTMAYSALANRGTINNSYYVNGAILEGDFSEYGKFFFDRYGAYAFTS